MNPERQVLFSSSEEAAQRVWGSRCDGFHAGRPDSAVGTGQDYPSLLCALELAGKVGWSPHSPAAVSWACNTRPVPGTQWA